MKSWIQKHFDFVVITAAVALCLYLVPPREWFLQDNIDKATVEAAKGDVKSQSFLAECYYYGNGIRPDGKKFLYYANKAAAQGDGLAPVLLAWFYMNNVNDRITAVKWARKAAATGHPRGLRYMGFIRHHGLGVERDDAEAVFWWMLAAVQDDDGSQGSLGNAYSDGLGVVQNYAKAAYWYGKNGAHGSIPANFMAIVHFVGAVSGDHNKAPAAEPDFRLEDSHDKPILQKQLEKWFPAGTPEAAINGFMLEQMGTFRSDRVVRISSQDASAYRRWEVSDQPFHVFYYKPVTPAGKIGWEETSSGWIIDVAFTIGRRVEVSSVTAVSVPDATGMSNSEADIQSVKKLLGYKLTGYPDSMDSK